MVVRYTMPCFDSHRHLLVEDSKGYIVQASDYDALLRENESLKKDVQNLTAQLNEVYSSGKVSSKKKKSTSRFIIKTMIDEDEWITVTDLKTGEIQYYDSKEEADANGRVFGVYKLEKVK